MLKAGLVRRALIRLGVGYVHYLNSHNDKVRDAAAHKCTKQMLAGNLSDHKLARIRQSYLIGRAAIAFELVEHGTNGIDQIPSLGEFSKAVNGLLAEEMMDHGYFNSFVFGNLHWNTIFSHPQTSLDIEMRAIEQANSYLDVPYLLPLLEDPTVNISAAPIQLFMAYKKVYPVRMAAHQVLDSIMVREAYRFLDDIPALSKVVREHYPTETLEVVYDGMTVNAMTQLEYEPSSASARILH